MNRLRIIQGLAWRNLRRRPGGAALLLIAMSLATTTLTMALSVQDGAQAPWDRTFTQTDGAQILANSEHPDLLGALTHAPGVVGSIGPFLLYHKAAYVHGYQVRLTLVGRDTLDTPIDHPLVTAGAGDLSGTGIVLEQSVADTLHAQVGDPIQVGGTTLTLRGIALSAAQPPFPSFGPGLAWVSRATATLVGAGGQPDAYQIELRLNSSTPAATFAATQHVDPRNVYLATWLDTRQRAMADIHKIRVILLTVSTLIALLTSGALAVLVATRMSSRFRQVGILKAVGLTPGQATAVSLVEYLGVALAATAVGLIVGTPLAALLTQPAGNRIGTRPGPLPNWSTALTVIAVAVALVAAAAIRPAWQAVRRTTLGSLAAPVRAPRRASTLARLTRALRLPLPHALGARSAGRRPARTLLTAGSLAIAVATATAALASQYTFMLQTHPSMPVTADNALVAIANRASDDQLRALVDLFTAVFVVLATANLVLVGIYAARDTAHNHAVLRAVGFTPKQTASTLITTQMVTAIPATLAGVPAGLLLFHVVYQAAANGQSDNGPNDPPAAWVAILVVATIALAGFLAAVPASALARRAVAPTLTTD
jgi:putative ABC transport system permease protein